MKAWLEGKKTYVIAAALMFATGAHAMGYISLEVYTIIAGMLGGGGLATLRAGVAKQ